jgi:hypothetical protein
MTKLLKGPDTESWRWGTPVRVPNQGCVEYWREPGRNARILVFYDMNNCVVETEWDWGLHGVFLDFPNGLFITLGWSEIRE